MTRLCAINDDSAVFSVGHIELVLCCIQRELVGNKQRYVGYGVLPRVQELPTDAKLEDTTIAVAVEREV